MTDPAGVEVLGSSSSFTGINIINVCDSSINKVLSLILIRSNSSSTMLLYVYSRGSAEKIQVMKH